MSVSRRTFIRQTGLCGAGLLVSRSGSVWTRSGPQPPHAPGDWVETIPFEDEGHLVEQPVGRGLQGRLTFDLSTLSPGQMAVSNGRFFIRTRASRRLPSAQGWTIQLRDRQGRRRVLQADWLRERAQAMGAHLLECSGNGRHRAFGLLSSADWGGIGLTEVIARMAPDEQDWGVLVSGFDHYASVPGSSVPGASWIFPLEEIASSGAFLATAMNGEALPREHGGPVRLVVPNWYGCCCIKWVNEVRLVSASAEATSQMREFAARTHQDGVPGRAVDYRPARIDFAAMPVRVELRRDDSGLFYHLFGIAWGGTEQVERLHLHVHSDEGPPQLVPVEGFEHLRQTSWNFWSANWRPATAGRYRLRLGPAEESIATQRLDTGFYDRQVTVRRL